MGKRKRVGRGYGSGKGGHTSGRGQKGQKARNSISLLFEGVKVKKSLIRRLPISRGKGKLRPERKPVVINVGDLEVLPSGTLVDINSLSKAGLVKIEEVSRYGIKVLGSGTLSKKLELLVPSSKSARDKVQEAGSKIV